MFKDSSLQYPSGGDPAEIVKMTHEDVKKFHEKHYTTDNCRIVIISKNKLEQELAVIERYAKTAHRGTDLQNVRQTVRSTTTSSIQYSSSNKNDTPIYLAGFQCFDYDTAPMKEIVAISMLDSILHDSAASPFKHINGQFSSYLNN